MLRLKLTRGTTNRRRVLHSVLTGLVLFAVVAGLVIVGSDGGYPADRARLLSGAAWLPSAQVGQLTLLDGSSAEVAAQVQVAGRGEGLETVQQGSTAYAVNTTTGTIRRVDGATFEISAPSTPIPDARDGLRALAGENALYALDTRRGVLVSADPRTLEVKGDPVPLATQITQDTATLDASGRLWTLDSATGDLTWIDDGRRRMRRHAAGAGDGTLVLADGAPVVVDTAKRTATILDPTSGSARDRVGLDLRADDRVQVTGSPHAQRLYVVASRGVLTVCDLDETSCGTAVPLGTDGQLGSPVETGGHLFVPDYATGRVWIVDLELARVTAQPQVLTPNTRFQLLTRDGVVFFNDPNSEHAGVIHLDGGVRTVAKYDPKNPTKGLTTRAPATVPSTPSTTPPPTTPPSQDPANNPPQQDPSTTPPTNPTPPTTTPPPTSTPPSTPPSAPNQPTAQITASATSTRVGAPITFSVAGIAGGAQPTAATWTFGDSQSSTGLRVDHSWTTVGTYQVSVQATFPGGRTATASVTITVIARPQLTVQIPTGGAVTGGGINCPGTCTATYTAGQSVTLTATPSANYRFGAWGGACTGTATTCTLTMTANVTVSASFTSTGVQPPTLLSPASNTTLTNYPRTMTLKWSQAANAASYIVEVQCDTCGSTQWSTYLNEATTHTVHTLTWPGDNQGRWRVTSVDANGNRSTPSGFWYFKFDTSKLPAPTLVSPANGTVFSTYPRDTTLTWRAVAGAAKYRIEILCDTCGGTAWTLWKTAEVGSGVTSYSFEWVGAQSGRWRVTTLSGAGTAGTPSAYWQFTYTR